MAGPIIRIAGDATGNSTKIINNILPAVMIRKLIKKDNLIFLGILAWLLSFPCNFYFFDRTIPISATLGVTAFALFFSCSLYFFFIFSARKHRFLFCLIIVLITIPAVLVLSAYSVTGAILHRSDFRVIYTTDLSESTEFVSQFLNFKAVLLVCLYLAPLSLLFKIKPSKILIGRTAKIVLLTLVLSSLSIICITNWRTISKRYHVFDFYRSYYDFIMEKQFDKWLDARKNLKFSGPVVSTLKTEKPQTFVLILGESLSRHHMQIYGYGRDTNPSLSAIRDQLFIFNDVISPATTTIDSMKFILTLANHQHPEYFLTGRSIANLFNEAGYKTIWIGNQNFRGNRYNISHGIIARECIESYEIADTTDNVLIDFLDKLLNSEQASSRIIFVHLRGCHTKYSTRYPKEFKYFEHSYIPIPYGSSLSESQKTIIDEYDNSVRYNDYIISAIIKLVKNRCDYSWVLYFSDHGEELFEYRNIFGHQKKNFSRYMCDIPFILWASDKYKNINKNLFRNTSNYLLRPYSTEDVIHSISDLSKLEYRELDKSKSIFSDKFIVPERRVNNILYNKIQLFN